MRDQEELTSASFRRKPESSNGYALAFLILDTGLRRYDELSGVIV